MNFPCYKFTKIPEAQHFSILQMTWLFNHLNEVIIIVILEFSVLHDR